MKKLCGICKIAGLFVVVGAINWGLAGVFNYNLVDSIFGVGSGLSRIVYAIVGIAGIMFLVSYVRICPTCQKRTA